MIDMSWVHVFSPLYICIVTLLLSSFSSAGSNRWWFGIREDFMSFFLNKFPALKLYGNNLYKSPEAKRSVSASDTSHDDLNSVNYQSPVYTTSSCDLKNEECIINNPKFGAVVPVELIENPD